MEKKIIGLEGFELYDSLIKDYISKQVDDSGKQAVISAESYLLFPTTGDSACLYIDKTNNKTYRWDDVSLKYYVVGSDYDEIQIIDGTGK